MSSNAKFYLFIVIDVVLMIIFALTLYEWDGVFVIIGALGGIGMGVAVAHDNHKSN